MGQNHSGIPPLPPLSPRSVPLTHKQALTEEDAHKLLLLECLFKAIDERKEGFLGRQDILDWVSNEPYLKQANLQGEAHKMLDRLNHDEDSSRCSYREFVLAFHSFSTEEVTDLITNLLRTSTLTTSKHLPDSNTTEIEPILSLDCDTPAHSRALYLLTVCFNAIDGDADGYVTQSDVVTWLNSRGEKDEWFYSQPQTELLEKITEYTSLFTADKPKLHKSTFLSTLSTLGVKHVKHLLIHLLHRTTHMISKNAKLQRRKSIVAHGSVPLSEPQMSLLKEMTGDEADMTKEQQQALEIEEEIAQDASLDINIPLITLSSLTRRHSVLIGGRRRLSTKEGLRMTFLGQSMIQYDVRLTKRGQETISHLSSLLQDEVVFSELESAIDPPIPLSPLTLLRASQPIFHHSASPAVIDVLNDLNINLLALSNNHACDMGVEGLITMMAEIERRNILYAGVGMNEAEATSPAYFNSQHGKIALISFATKVPLGTDATPTRAGVNAVWMEDENSQKLRKKDVAKIIASITSAKREAEIVIVYQHNHYWEKSNVRETSKLSQWKRKLAHKLIDAGATIYVGHGDPRLQAIEIYKGSPILYCLGNFIFQTKTEVGFYSGEVWEGVIVQLHHHAEGGGKFNYQNHTERKEQDRKPNSISAFSI